MEGDFSGGYLSSDAGGLLLRELESKLHLIEGLSACFSDGHEAELVEHELVALLRQRIVGVALAPNFTYDRTETIEKILKGAVAIAPENPPLVRVGAPGHDRNRPYQPQFLNARAGLANLVEMARVYGVKLVYEIHVGTVAVSCSRTLELLRDLDPDHIGAIFDVPNQIRVAIEDTRMGLELLGPYLAHCHIGNGAPVRNERDDTGKMQWQWEFCDLREGVADIPQIIQDLKDVGYSGYISLEEFGPGDDEQKIADQGAYLRRLIGG